MNDYVISVRQPVSDNTFGGAPGDARYLSIPNETVTPTTKHTVDNVQKWMDGIINKALLHDIEHKPVDIVFFVHGFDTTSTESISRQRITEYQLNNSGFPCIVIGFDWASAGNVAGYEYDRFEAHKAAQQLVTSGIIPFAMYNRKDCPINVHIVAHSMGGFVVREAFTAVEKMRLTKVPSDWRVSQIVFVAADISSGSFASTSTDMLPVFNHCSRLTNYCNGFDLALAVSNIKNMDIESRVGRVGMPVDNPGHNKAVDVDCSDRFNAVKNTFSITDVTLTHSWYFADDMWVEDLAHTLTGAIDRNLIPTRNKVGINDFTLAI